MRLEDTSLVRDEYASEARLAVRKRAQAAGSGPNAREIAFDAIAAGRPERMLEVGCGEGELAEQVRRELGCEVVALDQSERMVELTRARGVDARLGDVRDLPFDDESFDCAVAAWMLYHVDDVDRALAELSRVLRPGGRLVAVTNGRDHLKELRDLLGVDRAPTTFDAEAAGELLSRHFSRVETHDATGWLAFPDRAAAQAYVDASITLFGGLDLPASSGPLRVTRAPFVFVGHK